ncbi:MAG: cysteine--tRNA ligase [Candidatus Binataceae bacterium]
MKQETIPFHIFNTLVRAVEEFKPLRAGEVTLYSCGPTVYLRQHLGNMRAYLFVDTLKRALEYNGYEVRHVMNITDVGHMTSDEDAGEDKVEKTARAQGKSPKDVADAYFKDFRDDLELLNVELPEFCRATENIRAMVDLIKKILANGYAYETPSGVYFDVAKWRGPSGVGRLSRQSLDQQHAGQRLEHSPDKRSPHDFALWVLNQPGHLMQWDSPWGRGYPGWHIECSAMSMKCLNEETLDIHTGGLDHVPIHHENEIAQSESATGKPFVRYFVHNAFLLGMEGAKISKSAGKFPLLEDLIAEGIDPLAFRLFCFGAKYRSELAFSVEAVRAAQKNLDYFSEFAYNLPYEIAEGGHEAQWTPDYERRFNEAINDDLNTPRALAIALELISEAYRRGDKNIWRTLLKVDSVLGLRLEEKYIFAASAIPPDQVRRMCEERDVARARKDFVRADQLRDDIIARGYDLKDMPNGTRLSPRRRLE